MLVMKLLRPTVNGRVRYDLVLRYIYASVGES